MGKHKLLGIICLWSQNGTGTWTPRILDENTHTYKTLEWLHSEKFVDTFLSVEKWLYDTPPIPGNLYRQLINDCYRKNMLVSNSMYVDGKQIDLRKINIPLLSIVAEKDDLASPESSLAVNNYVSSKDKTDMKNPGGHVGLCISSPAHKKLWPEVTEWILAHN